MKRFDWRWAGVVALLVIIVLAVAVLRTPQPGISAAGPDTTEERGIIVNGEGEISVPPDIAFVSLGVETQATTAQQAQRDNARLMQQIVAKLIETGLKKEQITTANFSLYPVRKNSDTKITGYRVSNTVTVEMGEITKVGQVIDVAISGGANNVNSVSFSVKKPAQWRDEALEQAVKDARAKAEAIARGLDVSIQGAVFATDRSVEIEPYLAKRALMEDMAFSSSTPIQADDVKIRAAVQVKFRI